MARPGVVDAGSCAYNELEVADSRQRVVIAVKINLLLTNSMEPSTTREAPTCSYPESHQSSLHHPHTTSPRSIIIWSTHLRLALPSGPFPCRFPTDLQAFLYVLRAPPVSSSLIDHSNYAWWRAQNTKLLIIQLSPPSLHLIPHRSHYSIQHPVFKYPQSMFLP
jgi:hypothetical protein